MGTSKDTKQKSGKRSLFRALFVPLILVMIMQAVIFYFVAVYGGIEESLSQNAADILNERLLNRKNEVETTFHNDWTDLSDCTTFLNRLYADYETTYGTRPLLTDSAQQVQFLGDASDELFSTLRQNQVNGVFLILNDQSGASLGRQDSEKKYGLCIRDMDQTSAYTDKEDLLIERSPSSTIEQLGCSLDSWWEAQYTFSPEFAKSSDSFYYQPLTAAYSNPNSDGEDLAYLAGPHQLENGGQEVVSFSIPLISEDGYPYGVLGIELTTKYLSSILPSNELTEADKGCYVLALQDSSSTDCVPIVSNGALYNRCFDRTTNISTANTTETGGFNLEGRGGIDLYGTVAPLTIYNNNNPFEDHQLVLIALADHDTLFAYIDHVKRVLLFVAIFSLILGVICISIVSRHFAAPITALAKRVRNMKPEEGFKLDRLGITEIDQLVDSIDDLNQNVSRDIARTEFFSRMSHDMRTPMNAIISFSSPELLNGENEATKDNYLEKIHTSGEYLLGLINEVLDMTKIESKQTDLQLEPMKITRVWETAVPIIEKLAQKKGITFTKNVHEDSNIYLLADEQHLNQIVLNLLSNAVKFTSNGGNVSLAVDTHNSAADENQIFCDIVIQDNGIGISDDFMQDLYTPFEQENEGKEGTGLGLSIAKKLVELMNGSIKCDSKKDIGTTFHISIPFERCEAPAGKESEQSSDDVSEQTSGNSSEQPTGDVLSGKRILICEDHPLNTQIICRLLERRGIIVTIAENGKEGLETFINSPLHSFDAILMDIRMPVMDGLAATASIRALSREDAQSIPIMAMTANAFDEDVRASQKAGMNAHLSKPIEPQKLYETLEMYLKK